MFSRNQNRVRLQQEDPIELPPVPEPEEAPPPAAPEPEPLFRVTGQREGQGDGEQPNNRVPLRRRVIIRPPEPPPQEEQTPTPGLFVAGDIRRPPPPVPAQAAPTEWGPRINRPASVPVFRNQQHCVVCKTSIHQSFANKGWARCAATRKLVHGYCYEEWGECPVCHNCNMSIEGIVN